ncbi:inositol monophosphatase [Acidaminobacter sp. JC074]|uniref:inositol monophosphatase family protein n=1 Tax=Acidaminobacter sp. JC074 TaxID=2530199 RepID=UPI001F0F7AF7|nr:inositol monophosphatase [Acidaminobacter sp. JC074]MCH4886103.1 inositol monophosphatase [Acidaminobacter sp. JC074]
MIKELENILKHVGKNILQNDFTETYKDKDIVTNLDLEAERWIIQEIKKLRPHDLFISEEENQEDLTHEPTWIIDPIDGTLNFTRSIPQYGIQIALYENKEAKLSMMYFPESDQILYAKKGHGTFLNHERINISPMPLSKSIITFGDFSKSQPSSRPIQLKMMSDLMDHVMKIRIYGASSSDFSYVAIGKSQAHIIFTKRIWELAAGLLIIDEAGLKAHHIEFDTCDGYILGHPDTIDNLLEYIKRG